MKLTMTTAALVIAGVSAPIWSKTRSSGGTATVIRMAKVTKDMPTMVSGYIIVFMARCFASRSCSSMSAS